MLALVREVLGKAPVADESPMAKMADALREKGRQEQQAYQDSRVQSTEWGPMPHGTEADLPASAPVAGEAISDKRLWLMMAPWHLQMLRAHELRDVTEFGRAAYAAGMADAAPQASALAAEYALGRADGFDAAKAAPQTSPAR
ncbi:hypothetical protein QWC_31914 [Achromobacter marplatensis]|nr:hypothetical protein QWC_31914 [Achromobacter marplatensis]